MHCVQNIFMYERENISLPLFLSVSRIECIENFWLRYQSTEKYFDNKLCKELKLN